MTATQIPPLPDGWRIERVENDANIEFQIFEEDGPRWSNGTPRYSLTVEYWLPTERRGAMREPEVTWPSTTDRRPVLAQALAVALVMAAEEALR